MPQHKYKPTVGVICDDLAQYINQAIKLGIPITGSQLGVWLDDIEATYHTDTHITILVVRQFDCNKIG